MKNLLLAASCAALLTPCVGSAQGAPTEPIVKPVQSQSRTTPRPSGVPNRPAPANPAQFHPPAVAPPGSVNPGAANPYRRGPAGPGGVGPNHPVVGVPSNPSPPEQRYGVTRSAPGVSGGGYRQVRPGIRAGNRKHWGWNGRRYHLGRYNYPHGYRYRRWLIGQILPLVFLQDDNVFNDYAGLGFDDPPPGYEWVRYGPDLLLVDLDTGEVVDVEYGVFD